MSINGDSLILAGQLELLGGAGAPYNVTDGQRGLGDPQAITQVVQAQLTMGSYVTGDFTDNRTIKLQIAIYAPNRLALAQADSALRAIVNSSLPTTLQYTPAGGLPLIFDVFRGQVDTTWSRKSEAQGWRIVNISMLALPFGRSPLQRVVAGSSTSVQLGDFTQGTEYVYYTPSDQTNYYGDVSDVPFATVGNAYGPQSSPPGIDGTTCMRADADFWRPGFAAAALAVMVGPVTGTWDLAGCPVIDFGFSSSTGFQKYAQLLLTDSSAASQLFTVYSTNPASGWQYVTFSLTGATIDLSAIVSWQLWLNQYQGNNFNATTFYLGMLRAYPGLGSVASTTNGAVFKLGGILGDARAPASIQISRGINLLTAADASFESGVGSWVQVASTCTVTQSTTQALDGTHSMRLQSNGSGTMVAESTTRWPVTGGLTYTMAASFRSGANVRGCYVTVIWLDAGGTNVGNMQATPVNDTTSGWTRVHITGTAPAAAVACQINVDVGGGSFGELHYVDEVMLTVGTSSAFAAGTPWPTISGFLLARAPAGTSINTPMLLGVTSGHATTTAPSPFAGTYRVIGVNSSNIATAAAMTVTQSVNGTSVATATLAATAVAGGTHWGDFGDLTLPLIDVPNQAGNVTYDFAFTGTDLILVDTRGFLVWVPTMTAAPIIWVDEATAYGMGDVFAGTAPDRSDATSLLGLSGVQVSGAMSVDGGVDNYLLAFAIDGAPGGVSVSYYDRYLGERTAA